MKKIFSAVADFIASDNFSFRVIRLEKQLKELMKRGG